jgi:tripartite-type tricarboxylate transporter receptor subunit TctC
MLGIRGIAAFVALMAASFSAPAQNWPAQMWPNRPITIVVPFLAGGASDVIARLLADGLRAELG